MLRLRRLPPIARFSEHARRQTSSRAMTIVKSITDKVHPLLPVCSHTLHAVRNAHQRACSRLPTATIGASDQCVKQSTLTTTAKDLKQRQRAAAAAAAMVVPSGRVTACLSFSWRCLPSEYGAAGTVEDAAGRLTALGV